MNAWEVTGAIIGLTAAGTLTVALIWAVRWLIAQIKLDVSGQYVCPDCRHSAVRHKRERSEFDYCGDGGCLCKRSRVWVMTHSQVAARGGAR